jgi:hypothetical protein
MRTDEKQPSFPFPIECSSVRPISSATFPGREDTHPGVIVSYPLTIYQFLFLVVLIADGIERTDTSL